MPSQFLKKVVEIFGGGKPETDVQGYETYQPVTMETIDSMMEAPSIRSKPDEPGLLKTIISLFSKGGGGK